MLTRLFSLLIFGLSVIVPHGFAWAQNYNFTNYNLKEGLPQSQVNTIFQAKDRTLWLGSFGGVSNFDGINFKSFSKADGLLSNNVSGIVEDKKGQIWIATDNGINIILNGKVKKVIEGVDVYSLALDSQGNIWGLSKRRLFKLTNNKIFFVNIVDNEAASCLSKDHKGNLYAFVQRVGLFKLNNGKWQTHTVFPADIAKNYVVKLLFDHKNPEKFYLATMKNGIFSSVRGEVKSLFYEKGIEGYFDIAQDASGELWVATQKGAYLINYDKKPKVFDEHNGLKTNKINLVFKDVEDNIWLSSFGDGIFRYEGDTFIKYDKFKGRDLSYPVSGIAVDKHQKLWVSTFNKGLYVFDGEDITEPEVEKIKDKHIYFVTADRDSNILVSLQNHGLWKYNGKHFSQMPFTNGGNISSIVFDENKDFYLGELSSVTYLAKNRVEKITGFKGWVSCLLHYHKDSVILGTSSGAYLIKNRKIDTHFKIKALENAYVMGVVKQKGLLFFFTIGDGLISFDLKTKRTERYLTSSGLSSNDVYSATFDQEGSLWLGTGRGINKLNFDSSSNRYKIVKGNSPIVEANQNAILNFKGDILFGTTAGIVGCKTALFKERQMAPSVALKAINVFDRRLNEEVSTPVLAQNKQQPITLKHTQNHITIDFKGISLTSPKDVLYRYCLLGIDNTFGKAVSSTEAEYSALPPGTYTFKVYAEVNGAASETAQLTFVINPPYYATLWFKVLALMGGICLVWLLIYTVLKRKELERKKREIIKLEEQAKIRKQTAEDFHDDIGNKLTRINVLSEILEKKIDTEEKDQRDLIKMIKENASLLYTGTKDVLWALDPQSDNFYEIMQHVREFGIDLFHGTEISFGMENLSEIHRKWHMTMEQNRNITLVFKEILTNILKHAGAKNVKINLIEEAPQTVTILVIDDGKGFEPNEVTQGRGLQNIKNRCARINAKFDIITRLGEGTTVIISNIKYVKI